MEPELLKQYYEAGLRFLYFGIESGSQDVLHKMKKGVLEKTMRRVLSDTHAAGIWVHTYWILGFPGETNGNLIETAEFLLQESSSIDSFNFSNFFPLEDLKVWPDYVLARDHCFGDFLWWDSFYRKLTAFYFERINRYFELKYWLMQASKAGSRLTESVEKRRNRHRIKTVFSLLRTLHQFFETQKLRVFRDPPSLEIEGENLLYFFHATKPWQEHFSFFQKHPPHKIFFVNLPTQGEAPLVVQGISALREKGILLECLSPISADYPSLGSPRTHCSFCFHLFELDEKTLDLLLSEVESTLWEQAPEFQEEAFWSDWVYQRLVEKSCLFLKTPSPLLTSSIPTLR
jgi:hypothetical protein